MLNENVLVIEEGTKEVASGAVVDRFSKVKTMHLTAFFFMFIQAIIYGVIGADLEVVYTTGFQEYCNSAILGISVCGSWNRAPAIQALKAVNPIWLMTFFVTLAAADHLVSYLYMDKREESARFWLYTAQANPFRWIEYSISASSMVWGLSVLNGIHDVHLVMCMFGMTCFGMVLGFVIEVLPKEDNAEVEKQNFVKISDIRRVVWWVSAWLIFIPWLIQACYFVQSASAPGSQMPKFVYGAFSATFVMFCLFAANSYMHNILKRYTFETAEITYIWLSFFAKTFLAMDVFAGLKASSS